MPRTRVRRPRVAHSYTMTVYRCRCEVDTEAGGQWAKVSGNAGAVDEGGRAQVFSGDTVECAYCQALQVIP